VISVHKINNTNELLLSRSDLIKYKQNKPRKRR
jgi:hypothetical protein